MYSKEIYAESEWTALLESSEERQKKLKQQFSLHKPTVSKIFDIYYEEHQIVEQFNKAYAQHQYISEDMYELLSEWIVKASLPTSHEKDIYLLKVNMNLSDTLPRNLLYKLIASLHTRTKLVHLDLSDANIHATPLFGKLSDTSAFDDILDALDEHKKNSPKLNLFAFDLSGPITSMQLNRVMQICGNTNLQRLTLSNINPLTSEHLKQFGEGLTEPLSALTHLYLKDWVAHVDLHDTDTINNLRALFFKLFLHGSALEELYLPFNPMIDNVPIVQSILESFKVVSKSCKYILPSNPKFRFLTTASSSTCLKINIPNEPPTTDDYDIGIEDLEDYQPTSDTEGSFEPTILIQKSVNTAITSHLTLPSAIYADSFSEQPWITQQKESASNHFKNEIYLQNKAARWSQYLSSKQQFFLTSAPMTSEKACLKRIKEAYHLQLRKDNITGRLYARSSKEIELIHNGSLLDFLRAASGPQPIRRILAVLIDLKWLNQNKQMTRMMPVYIKQLYEENSIIQEDSFDESEHGVSAHHK